MGALDAPYSHYVSAASGWLDLGNPGEAAAELNRIPFPQRGHPEVLDMWWRVHAARKRWEEALTVARILLRGCPDEPQGWVDQAFALHEMRRTLEAWQALLPAAKKFPDNHIIPYNLACYASRLGNQIEAKRWLDKAAAVAGKEAIQKMALQDQDLKALWETVRRW